MGFNEDMFALLKTKQWGACHQRIAQEERVDTREARVSTALWRATIFERENRYDDALRTLDAIQPEVFTQCGLLWERAKILYRMGKYPAAIETLHDAPFGAEIDTFPGITYEAIFLYCYLLKKSGHEAPLNLLTTLPDDFGTRFYERRRLTKADLLPAGASAPPT
ncbi:MAG TPA: hypothetical protein VIJ63_19000 [Roseiarcus sp.]